MKKWFLKDTAKRIAAYQVEKNKIFYKYIFYNCNFNKKVRENAYKHFNFYSASFKQRNRVKLRCILSGRSRSNSVEYGLSRITFRNLISFGLIPGIRKSSW
jgi:small subunit ribosomal protein S14